MTYLLDIFYIIYVCVIYIRMYLFFQFSYFFLCITRATLSNVRNFSGVQHLDGLF